MKTWMLTPGGGPRSLELIDVALPQPGPGQVRVRMEAASLNARDLMIADGHYPGSLADTVIPLSDGAGRVSALGPGVDGVDVGARVVIAWNPAHLDGHHQPWMMDKALGALHPGLLRHEVVVDASALVALPEAVSFEQAACLPCAGSTAWNALFVVGALRPGQIVLATGTGGLSLIALQLAKAAGAVFGITSADDERLALARRLGADFTINYATRADWHEAVKEATDGVGAHVILENAGPVSIAQSMKAAAQGGRVCQIGWKGIEGPPVDIIDMAMTGASLVPIQGGSRRMLAELVAAVAANRIEVPVAKTFAFEDAPLAFASMARGHAFGKVVIKWL